MKSYTDLEQSEKLAEFLPLKSADMYYHKDRYDDFVEIPHFNTEYKSMVDRDIVYCDNIIPCWSLSALFDILEGEIDGEEGETYQLKIEKDGDWWSVWYEEQYDEANPIETESTQDILDACYKMIVKLHEENLL